MCSSNITSGGNIFPLTEENLDLLEITPQPLTLKSLPDWLVLFPALFVALTFANTFIQVKWEQRIERKEKEVRDARAGRKKAF
jgi:hypothetical protein